MKKLYILMGPSGTGKTTLGNYMKNELGVSELVSCTTRKMREGEVPDETYYFLTEEEFEKIDRLEETVYNGNHYCLSKKELDNKLKDNDKVFIIADINGVNQIKEKVKDIKIIVIFVDVSYGEMEKRMRLRGDSEENIEMRLEYSKQNNEKGNRRFADYIIMNDSLEVSKMALEHIIQKGER